MSDKDTIRLIREALRKFNRHAGVLKADPYGIGLSLSQSSALVDIARFEHLRAADLVELLRLDKSTVSRLLAGLRESGYLTTQTGWDDGRSRRLSLTPAGRRIVKVINEISEKSVSDALQPLSLKKRKEIAASFHAFATALDKTKAND